MLVWCDIQIKTAPYSVMVRYEVVSYVGLLYVDIFLP